jgi:hypothetical protein
MGLFKNIIPIQIFKNMKTYKNKLSIVNLENKFYVSTLIEEYG